MNELLTKLYYGQINISDQKPKTARSDAESNLFDKLQERLSKDDFNVFQEFLMLYADRYSDYQEFAFSQGVKLGFALSKELNDFEL